MPADVVIIIPTYRRPDGLARALASATAQEGAPAFEVLIVDNDAAGPSARPVVETAAKGRALAVRYVHEARPGVAHARNTGLASTDAPLIAFLDDDEEAPADWLAKLVAAHHAVKADVTFGPVRGRVPAGTRHADYLARFFSRLGPDKTGPLQGYFGCGNSLISRASLPSTEPFDPVRNLIGGEDDLLFGQMQAARATFGWAADAFVWEDPIPARLNLGYTLKRAFAYGQGPSAHCAVHRDLLGMLGWMAVGVAQTGLYGAQSALRWLTRSPRLADSLDRTVRGLGKTFWGGPFNVTLYGQS